ncbi:DNA-directed DNA/RNA polymerase mu [Salvelinus fontinalis]|uniref:DNA-directed DNA/RNA polymerase mu n=1 Tax=Salvelinus fontinalis TaxID=8038 RepID=UPI002484EC27|nr:DNA-directed DNA/RNA polymerase mu [Salvelinus fontinalis]
MIPLKRRKVNCSVTSDSSGDRTSKFPGVVIFLLERKMGASRRAFLTRLGRGKGFNIEYFLSRSITHIVSENNSGEEVRTWLDLQTGGQSREGGEGRTAQPGSVHLLDMVWYTESMHAGIPVIILDRHRLQEREKPGLELAVVSVPSYACQRHTPLLHHNTTLTDALSILAENAELSENEGRGVAFRRAAALLKSLPQEVRGAEQLRGLPCLGEHSLRVIKEVLEDGVSHEVETTTHSEQFKAMKALTGIFGVGAKTADRWFREGIHTPSDLQRSGHTLNRAQRAGLQYYDELNLPVTKSEAVAIGQIVERAVHAVLPGAEIILIGGFRRGKQTGHDVDFLITHPDEGREGLMPKVVSWLEAQGFLLYQKTTRNSYLESKEGPARPASNMDRFERCFSIFRLSTDNEGREIQTGDGPQTYSPTLTNTDPHTHSDTHPHSKTDSHPLPQTLVFPKPQTSDFPRLPQTPDHAQKVSWVLGHSQCSGPRSWRAVRVDLVVSPYSQFAFALLGWTGSKLFERELRRWAVHEKAMTLSSHALYDRKRTQYLRASSEEEIFAHLGLEYIPPCDRNA